MDTTVKMLKNIAFIFCLWCSYSVTLAESARNDAMGEINIINDFSHIIYNPASINDFPDQCAGSAGSFTDTNGLSVPYFGPCLVKKSLTSLVNIGVIANTVGESGSSVLRTPFYKNARAFLVQDSAEMLPTSFSMIPHLVLGLDFGDIGIGAEAFYEMAHYKVSIDRLHKSTDKGIYNFGGKLNANIVVGDFWFCPQLVYSVPYIMGEVTDSLTNLYRSNKTQHVMCGTEIGYETSPTAYVAGIYFTNDDFQFHNSHIQSPRYTSSLWDLYAGCTTTILTDVLVACEYDLTIENDDILASDTLTQSTIHGQYLYHTLHAGVEKPFVLSNFFDKIIPRAGLIYRLGDYSDKVGDTLIQYPLTTNTIELNAGIGLRKNIFALDVFVNIGTWDGVMTGPKAVAVTLTVGLSKDFLGKE